MTHDADFFEYKRRVDETVGVDSRFMQLPLGGSSPFWILAYDNVPHVGRTTTFTFGISSVRHPDWKSGAPEIVMSLESTDNDWWLGLAAICAALRGSAPFSLGDTLNFGRPVSNESLMSAFFLFWPMILQAEEQQVELRDRTIIFIQAYPVFNKELELISKYGSERFFMLDDLEFSDVSRNAVSNESFL